MAYLLDGRTLSPDAAFTHNDIQYPAGWIRRVSEKEREAIGMEWQDDLPIYDSQFWYGYDKDGNLIPRDLVELKGRWLSNVKKQAGRLLARTDWMIIRQLDPSSEREVGAEVLAERAQIRQLSDDKELLIEATNNVAEFAELVTSAAFNEWLETDAP